MLYAYRINVVPTTYRWEDNGGGGRGKGEGGRAINTDFKLLPVILYADCGGGGVVFI